MSDARVRELERLAAGGDRQAEAALVLARMRDGTLPREQALLLAYCEHPVAGELLAEPPPTGLGAWSQGVVEGWGTMAAVVAASGGAQGCPLPGVEGRHEAEPTLTRALHALDLWRSYGGTAESALREAERETRWQGQRLHARAGGGTSSDGTRLNAAQRQACAARGSALLAASWACRLPGSSDQEAGEVLATSLAASALARASFPSAAEAERRVAAFPELESPPGDLAGALHDAREALIAWAAKPVRQDPQLSVARLQRAYLEKRIGARELECANYLGFDAARTALRGLEPVPEDLVPWIEGLARWGSRPLVEAALVLARDHLRQVSLGEGTPEGEVLLATTAWLQDPSSAHRRRLLTLSGAEGLEPAAERLALAAGSSSKAQTKTYAGGVARWLLAWRACLDATTPLTTARAVDRLLARPERATAHQLRELGLDVLPSRDATLRRRVAEALIPSTLASVAAELGLSGGWPSSYEVSRSGGASSS